MPRIPPLAEKEVVQFQMLMQKACSVCASGVCKAKVQGGVRCKQKCRVQGGKMGRHEITIRGREM